MAPTATKIFEVLAAQTEIELVRHEFEHGDFNEFRAALRALIRAFSPPSPGAEHGENVRWLLLQTLCSPVRFDQIDRTIFDRVGDLGTIPTRWGSDVLEAYLRSAAAFDRLARVENPLRSSLQSLLSELLQAGRIVRVFCYRSEVAHYRSLGEFATAEARGKLGFIYTARDYRESAPFDVLVKVGPLRTEGYSSMPPGILTAPRFARLEQFVWGGLRDDPAAFVDPVMAPIIQCPRRGVRWIRESAVHGTGHGLADWPLNRDELSVFARRDSTEVRRPAVMLGLGGGWAVLEPPGSEILTLHCVDPEVKRITASDATPSIYLIWPDRIEADVEAFRAAEGTFAAKWKERLRRRLETDRSILIRELRAAEVDLEGLPARVREWSKPATTVIHAPQRAAHFKALISALGLEEERPHDARPSRREWWMAAWREVQLSRAAAINAGVQKQEMIDDALLAILDELSDEIACSARRESTFRFTLPERSGLRGFVTLYRIENVEFGYRAPESVMKRLLPVVQVHEWHA